MKTICRDWLLKQIENGKITGKCDMSLTDDYAFDNATGFGKTDWMPVRIRHPRFDKITLPNGNVIDHCSNDDRTEGAINLDPHDFRTKSGGACENKDGSISFWVHSNLAYTLRMAA